MNSVLGLETPKILPDVLGLPAAGRLIWTTLLFIAMLTPVVIAVRRPKLKQKATWAQAMGGAIFVWALMILAYGSIPHEWLQYASSYHKWDESHFLVRSGQELFGPFHWLNLSVDKRAIADAVASVIYLVMLGMNIYLFAAWQKRPEAKDDATTTTTTTTTATDKVVGTSAFGRPVTAKV
jgi:hypothetical protein